MRTRSRGTMLNAIALLALATLLATVPSRRAQAQVYGPGFYLGASVGQSRVNTDAPQYGFGDFHEYNTGFKVMAGVRPLPMLGAEIAYVDFGNPSGAYSSYDDFVDSPYGLGDIRIRGAAAFGVLYLPVPFVDVFLKAGADRLQSEVNGYGYSYGQPSCGLCAPQLFRLDRTGTGFAAGGGLQYRLGPWAFRAEYEHFGAPGGNPSMLSAGIFFTIF